MEVSQFLFLFSAVIVVLAIATDPFSLFSIIRLPYKARFKNDKLAVLDKTNKLKLRQNMLWRWFAVIKCGVHIMYTRYISSPRADSKTVQGIINDIHWLRFNPKKLLLISGDHFSALFVRNLGVFYYPMLDNNFAIDEKDWQHRQIVYLQTLAYSIEVFSKQDELTTTIVSTGSYHATCVNFYAYPSDTLFGMFYAAAILSGKESATPYDYSQAAKYELKTQNATKNLIKKNKDILKIHYKNYRQTIFDEDKMLVKDDVHLSGAKDITKRNCAFYDNVVFWRTTQLAMSLGIISNDQKFLESIKANIIKSFWYEKEGYFLEDLSERGLKEKLYSSDWLIILSTKFLDPKNPKDKKYYQKSIDYVMKEKIDQPFAIKYQNQRRANRQFWFVRLAVASYGGSSIWSFWGMEYIKTLMILAKTEKSKTKKSIYIKAADYHIERYKEAMLRDGGFAEVFDQKGNMLTTRMYKSIRQTGWVVGFEQVLEIRKQLKLDT